MSRFITLALLAALAGLVCGMIVQYAALPALRLVFLGAI